MSEFKIKLIQLVALNYGTRTNCQISRYMAVWLTLSLQAQITLSLQAQINN